MYSTEVCSGKVYLIEVSHINDLYTVLCIYVETSINLVSKEDISKFVEVTIRYFQLFVIDYFNTGSYILKYNITTIVKEYIICDLCEYCASIFL